MQELHQAVSKLGWRSTQHSDSLEIEGDGVESFRVARAFSGGDRYVATPRSNHLHTILLLEGDGTVHYDGTPIPFRSQQVLFLDAEASVVIDVTLPSARFVWNFSPLVLKSNVISPVLGEPIAVDIDAMRPLLALTNAGILGKSVTRDPFAVQTSTEIFLRSGILRNGYSTGTRRGNTTDAYFSRAHLEIETHFRNPSFGVERLSANLNVSTRHLRRVFAAMDTSPRRELERRRISEARGLLEHSHAASGRAQDFIAESSGFTSRRSMFSALTREKGLHGSKSAPE